MALLGTGVVDGAGPLPPQPFAFAPGIPNSPTTCLSFMYSMAFGAGVFSWRRATLPHLLDQSRYFYMLHTYAFVARPLEH